MSLFQTDLIKIKRILLVLALLFSQFVFGTNYYVSNAGNDANNGRSEATAWRTIGRVNSFNFNDFDNIYFRRGDTFYGGIIANTSNLSFDAYGSGAKPVITGLSAVTGWVNLGGNIWEAPVTNVKNGVNLVLRNGAIQQVGRYPNVDAANGGYLTYTASSTTSITGPALSATTNWTGAEVTIRINRWDIRRQIVTSHSAGVVSFAANAEIPRLKYGYFFQRDSRTLDKDGEWWHNVANNKLRMYFSNNNPNAFNVQIATVDNLFYNLYSDVSVSNLSFYGSDKKSIWHNGGSGITIKNCDVNNSGKEAITVWFSTDVIVDNCIVNNSLGSGIRVQNSANGKFVNLNVTNCNIDSTALIAGMETSNELNGGAGILCKGGNGLNVLNNYVTNSGYNGIQWQGNDVNLKYNFVSSFCIVRDDGGGIYTVENGGSSLPVRSNRNVISNIVINGIGANKGSDDANGIGVSGLYGDLGSRNITIDSNTVTMINGNSFHGNNNANLTFRNNVFFGNRSTISLQRFGDAPLVRNITMTQNTLYPYRFRYRNLGLNFPSLITKEADIKAMGVIDNNYYSLKSGPDTSLTAVTTNADLSNYKETVNTFPYITGTIGIEKNSINFPNTVSLEYNASSKPKIVNFSGLSKKDVNGSVFNNTVTIQPWSSMVLIPNGPAVVVSNKIPVVKAGVSQTITLPVNTVALNGIASDSDGVVISYAWSKISGPAGGTIVLPDSSRTNINNLSEGIYQFALNVTDNNSGVGKDTVTITVKAAAVIALLPAVNPVNTVNGLNYRYFEGNWTVLPSFNTLTPVKTGTVDYFDITPANRSTEFGFSFTGFINIPSDGIYTFYLISDDGSSLYIDDSLIVSHDGLHGPTEKSGTIGLKAGFHAIEGLYFQESGNAAFSVSYQENTIEKQTIPLSQLYRINTFPEVNAGSNQTITLPISSITLAGTANDIDGTISSYAWAKISGPSGGTIASPNSAGTAFNNLTEGTYQYVLSATDNNGAVGRDTVTITVNAAIRILLPAITTTIANSVNGLNYKYFEGNWTVLPSFNTLTPVKTGTVDYFDITPANRSTEFGFSFTGFINIPSDGIYTFYLISDDGSSLYIDDSLIVSHDGLHGPTEKSGTIGLKAGFHAIEGLYFQESGNAAFSVSYQENTIEKQTIPLSQLYRINTFPEVNAGSNQTITLPISSITLAGTANDIDGTISSYAWAKISGPSGGTIASPNSAGTAFNNLTEGTYQYVLSATDNNGAVGRDTVIITVNAAIRILLPAITTTIANSVNGLNYKYFEGNWKVLPSFNTLTPVKTGTVNYFDITPANRSSEFGFSFTGFINIPSDGIYTFYITSDDGSSLYIDDSLIVSHDGLHGPTEKSGTIGLKAGFHAIEGLYFQEAGNAAFSVSYQENTIEKQTIPLSQLYRINTFPEVNAGSNQTITLPISSITLAGTANDIDGTISSYAWAKISGPSGGTIASPNSAGTAFNNLTEGTYQYVLSATDNNGAVGRDTVIITVNAAIRILLPATTTTIANSVNGLNYKYFEGNWKVLPSFNTLTPVKTGTVDYFDITPANRSTEFGFSFTGFINIPSDGIYTFYITSDDGSSLYIDDSLIVSHDGLHGPTEKSGTIGLKAGFHAIEGLYFQEAGSAVFNVSYLVNGADKQTITESQLYRNNNIPFANAGSNRTISLPTSSVTLTGTANDTDGTISSYAWEKISGPASGTIASPNTAITAINNLSAGIYQFILTATDNDGGAGKDTITITVNAAIPLLPAVTIVNEVPGLDYNYYEGNWTVLPSFNTLTPIKNGTVANFDISLANKDIQYGFSFTGYINVPVDGVYTFFTTSDDGSRLYIDDSLIVNNDGIHGPTEKSGSIGLEAGYHAITGLFFQQAGTGNFSVSYQAANIAKQIIPESQLFRIIHSESPENNLLPAVNPANTITGLDYKYYEGSWKVLPAFNTLTPIKTGTIDNFDISLADRSTDFGFSFTGFIDVPADGVYTFYATSDDGSRLFIDGVLTINNDGIHNAIEKSGIIGLKAGKHAISGLFFQQAGSAEFAVSYESNTILKQRIPVSQLYRVINSESPENNLLPAVSPANTITGLDYKYYEGNWTVLPSFKILSPIKTGTVDNFDISVSNRSTQFGFNFTGFIDVPADGVYTFYATSDDGSKLYIDDVLTINNDGIHNAIEKSGVIGLKAGKHAISGLFFQQSGSASFNVSYESSTIAKQTIPESQLYRINDTLLNLRPAINPANTITGLDYKYYEGNWNFLPTFDNLIPVKTGIVDNFDITPANRSSQFGFHFTGLINVPADGIYTFYTTSDDGSNLYVDDVLIVNNDGIHGALEKSGSIGLKAGKHFISGLYFQQAGGAVFNVSYESATLGKQIIPSSQLYRISPPIAGRSAVGNSLTVRNTTQLNVVNDPTSLKISSFPNPSNYEFKLNVEGGKNEKIEILVMDSYGKSVFKAVGNSNQIYKFGNKFLPGIYVVKVIQGNVIQLTKVVKL